jgi:hypothetical protein
MREELPFPDKVLQTLHNLCATAADLARRGEEVAGSAEGHKRNRRHLTSTSLKVLLKASMTTKARNGTILMEEA